MDEDQDLPEKFSDDPEENLRLENEYLKMKLSAETGAVFGGDASDLPPEIINEWLKNVAAFEKNYAEGKEVLIRELLGNPDFKEENLMSDEEFDEAYDRLLSLMEEKNIQVNFIRERDDRFKYNFITKELFDESTNLVPVAGMVTNFIYEEFHPDHEMDIQNKTHDFFAAFFERRMVESGKFFLADQHILPDGQVLPREQILARFESMYEVVPEFENTSFEIEKIDFELKEEEESEIAGMGYSEGNVQYEMIFRDGTRKKIDGPFKIYFGMQWDWWTIYFFYLAGFNMRPPKEEKSQ